MADAEVKMSPTLDDLVLDAYRAYESVPTRTSVADAVIAHAPVGLLDDALENIDTHKTRLQNTADDTHGTVARARDRDEYWQTKSPNEEYAIRAVMQLTDVEVEQQEAATELQVIEASAQQADEISKRRLRLSMPVWATTALACATLAASASSEVFDNQNGGYLGARIATTHLAEAVGGAVGGYAGFMLGVAMSGQIAKKRASRIVAKQEVWTVK